MQEEGYVIRGINWRETFPFTNIFRSFRIAFHPSKMVLGLALLLTVYVGGSILDFIWPVHARALTDVPSRSRGRPVTRTQWQL